MGISKSYLSFILTHYRCNHYGISCVGTLKGKLVQNRGMTAVFERTPRPVLIKPHLIGYNVFYHRAFSALEFTNRSRLAWSKDAHYLWPGNLARRRSKDTLLDGRYPPRLDDTFGLCFDDLLEKSTCKMSVQTRTKRKILLTEHEENPTSQRHGSPLSRLKKPADSWTPSTAYSMSMGDRANSIFLSHGTRSSALALCHPQG